MTIQNDILAILEQLRNTEFTEVEIGNADLSVIIRKRQADQVNSNNINSSDDQQSNSILGNGSSKVGLSNTNSFTINSPMMGIFYNASRPGEKPFVEIGSKVGPETVICVIEVMKLMNSVSAGVSGVVESVLVKDGSEVASGAPLFQIRADKPDGVLL